MEAMSHQSSCFFLRTISAVSTWPSFTVGSQTSIHPESSFIEPICSGMTSEEVSLNPPNNEQDRIEEGAKAHSQLQSQPSFQPQPLHTRSSLVQELSTSTHDSSSFASASPLALPELLPSSSDRSSCSTMNSSSSHNSPMIQPTADASSSKAQLSAANVQMMDRPSTIASEQEKQAHYVTRRSPLGPRPVGSFPFEQSEEEDKERIERAQAQAERDMYAHMHAHIKSSVGTSYGEERRKRSVGSARADGENYAELSNEIANASRIGAANSAAKVMESSRGKPSQDQEYSQRNDQLEAQLQAAAEYASLASLAPPLMLKETSLHQEDSSLVASAGPSSLAPRVIQEEMPRLSTSSAESSNASDVPTPEKSESGIWGRSENLHQGKGENSDLAGSLERKMDDVYLDPEPDTQSLQNIHVIANQSSMLSSTRPVGRNPTISSVSPEILSRPPMASRQRSSDKASASSSHTAIPSRSSSIRPSSINLKPHSSATLINPPLSPPSTISSTSSAAQTPAASQDRDPMADAMKPMPTGSSLQSDHLSSSISLDLMKPTGMSASGSNQRRSPPAPPLSLDRSSRSSSSIPHSSPTTSTASAPGPAPTSPTTSEVLSLRASLASPDSWRSLLPEHDPYFADPDAEEGSRSTAGSVSGTSGSASGHGHNPEDRFRGNSRQNSSTGISAVGSSALGIAAMNTPSATSLTAQLAQFGVGEPFPRCSSRGSAAGSSNGVVPPSVNQNGSAYAYAYGTSSSAAQDHMRKLSNTSQLSSFSLPGPTPSNSVGQEQDWEERERERMKRESWRSFLPEGDPAHPTSAANRRDMYASHRRTNTNSAASVDSSPSLSFSDSPRPTNQQPSPHWSRSQQQLSPRLNRTGLHEELASAQPSQSGSPSLSNSVSMEAARRHASFSAWETAQRDRDGFRGTTRRAGQDPDHASGTHLSSMLARNGSAAPKRAGSITSNASFSPFGLPSEGMVHSHSQPPYPAAYPTSSTSTSHSTTQITSYRNMHQQRASSSTSSPASLPTSEYQMNSARRLPASAVMGDIEERESWPSSGTSLSSSSLSGDSRGRDRVFDDGEHRRASGLRGDLEGWTPGRDAEMGSMGLTRTYEPPVSIVQEHLDPTNNAVLLTTTTTTTTTTFTRVSQQQQPSQSESPASERSKQASPQATAMQARSFSGSGHGAGLSCPISVPQPSSASSLQEPMEASDSPYLVSPLSPPSVPFLDHRQAPASTNLTIETNAARYVLILRLPNFSIEHITLATKHHRTLHIVADNWREGEGGGHVERRVTFHSDALMRQVQAEFDGELLKVIVPRRITHSNQNALSPIIQPSLNSISQVQQGQQPQQQRIEEGIQGQS